MSAVIQTYETKGYQPIVVDQRRKELEPQLARLALIAKNTYRTLAPLASPETEKSKPALRLRQIEQIGQYGIRHRIADLLIVTFSEEHDLTIRRNFKDGHPMPWVFSRSVISEELREDTRINELAIPRIGSDGGRMDMNVDATVDGTRLGPICSFANHFNGAEEYIAEMQADLQTAVTEFSSPARLHA